MSERCYAASRDLQLRKERKRKETAQADDVMAPGLTMQMLQARLVRRS
jgi:hypothetical protein